MRDRFSRGAVEERERRDGIRVNKKASPGGLVFIDLELLFGVFVHRLQIPTRSISLKLTSSPRRS